MKRGLLRAGLLICAPCVLLLVALPVGFVMEIGVQVRLRLVNRSSRPLTVTPLGTGGRVAALTLHPLLPFPAFRGVDLPLDPGETRTVYYSGRRTALRSLAVRERSGERRELVLPAPARRKDVEIILDDASVLLPSTASLSRSVLFPWAILLAGPLGTFAFLRFRRALTTLYSGDAPPRPPPPGADPL